MKRTPLIAVLSPAALFLASCGTSAAGDSAPAPEPVPASKAPFTITEVARFDEPWAMAFIPGTPSALVTEMRGSLKLWKEGGKIVSVAGVPAVDYGGQGGLGDILPAPDFVTSGTVYLSWVEAGPDGGDTRGAAVGMARLVLGDAPRLDGLQVIWRQSPKVTGRGHFSHRLAISPDGRALFIASGDRQKMQPAQDPTSDLGKIVRLPIDRDGKPAGPADHHSLGHRNILGLAFAGDRRLWSLEHGPAGGDELNLVETGRNYGWPIVSQGNHYDGKAIPRHAARPEFAPPAISWNPVIAPGDFIFYRGDAFPQWRGQALIAAMKPAALVRVAIDGNAGRELARYTMTHRIRDIAQRDDGSVWLLEDGKERGAGRLLRLEPAKR